MSDFRRPTDIHDEARQVEHALLFLLAIGAFIWWMLSRELTANSYAILGVCSLLALFWVFRIADGVMKAVRKHAPNRRYNRMLARGEIEPDPEGRANG